MLTQTKTFGTRGPVDPTHNYVVPRTAEIDDLKARIKQGRYIVIFAPRQTGKTTFFRWTLESLVKEEENWFPIQLDFQTFKNVSVVDFYSGLKRQIQEEIGWELQRRGLDIDDDFSIFWQSIR